PLDAAEGAQGCLHEPQQPGGAARARAALQRTSGTLDSLGVTVRTERPYARAELALAAASHDRRPAPGAGEAGAAAFRVRRGELLHYRVALTNTGKTWFRFAHKSCRTYIEQMLPAPTQPCVPTARRS